MNEIREKRSLTSKTFDNNDGSFKLEAHIGHIHYNNKLGVGDGVKGLRSIDWDLQWDDVRKGWYFEHHSFNPFIPEYSDGWIEFRDLFDDKDQTIKTKAICNRVKGRLVDKIDKITEANAVIYDNAFGEGIDYIIYFSRSMMKRVVRIRDGYKPTEDAYFDFELDLPDKKVYRAKNRENIAYELDLKRDKEFDTDKQLLIGNDQQDGKEWFSYIRKFKVWDNRETREDEIIKVQYFLKDGKTFLRKIIGKEYLDKSIGDVFTDDTSSYYAGAGDGRSAARRNDWDEAHDADFGRNEYGTSHTWDDQETILSGCADHNYLEGRRIISRGFFPIDTSELSSSASISDASLELYVHDKQDKYNDSYAYVAVVGPTTQASNTSLEDDDFNECGDVDDPDKGSADFDITNISVDDDLSCSLNSTGLGWISKTGYTKLGMREGHDIEDEDVGDSSSDIASRIIVRASEYTGTDYDPYLSVTYTTPSASLSPSISPSQSPSASFSPSFSPSLSPSVSPSLSASLSSSISPSASFSPSISSSVSPSASLSPSFSPSLSASLSPSLSPSISSSVSPSASLSPSISPSFSPSLSPSLSASLSPSLSPSISSSISPSASLSPSFSPSLSASLSASLSPSISPSQSPSASFSPSFSPSLSASASPSFSPSISPSQSPSVSFSPSLSPSLSASLSASLSPSISPSVSPSASISPSISPSVGEIRRGGVYKKIRLEEVIKYPILKRWNGNEWEETNLKIYEDNTWKRSNLKAYIKEKWITIKQKL